MTGLRRISARLVVATRPLGTAEPASGRVARLALAALLALALAVPSRAWAAAFNEPAGEGIVIVRGTADRGARSFDRKGHVVRSNAYTKREADAYVQYGVTDWLQAIVKPDIVSTSLGGRPGGRYTGIGTSEVGAQLQVLRDGPAVFAVQGTVHLPATTRNRNLALIGNTSRDADGRALAGLLFDLGPWPSFVDGEVGYRIRSAGAPDEVRLDMTVGTRPRPDTLLLLQSFTTVPTAAGVPFFPRSTYSNLEASVVYDLDTHFSVQVGAFITIDGRNALRERAVETSIWYRF